VKCVKFSKIGQGKADIWKDNESERGRKGERKHGREERRKRVI
jgi:hypothetical protein